MCFRSRLYSIVGEFADWEHRYDEIVVLMKEAVALDAKDAKAEAELGFNLTAEERRLGLREIDSVVSCNRQLCRHKGEHFLVSMTKEGVTNCVVDVEKVANGRLSPCERGADLFRVRLLKLQHADHYDRKR